jgi:5-methylcytosine-specific restriction endonuclease McrA
LTSSIIKDCVCKNPNHVVVIERTDYNKYRLFYQCSICGYADRSKCLKQKIYDEQIRLEFDERLFKERNQNVSDEQNEISERFAIFKKSKYYKYQTYLDSDQWKELRQKVFARDNGICFYCKTHKAEQVHHKHYLTLYKENLDDLESVCASCHHDIHKSVFASV